MSVFQAQILSDLHLEHGHQYNTFTFPTAAPYLILAGDIGRVFDYGGFLSFLSAQSARYKKVFLVLGNHEFYMKDYDWAIERAQKLCNEPCLNGRVILLHRTCWDDPESDITIVGCTLWSRIPKESYKAVELGISDFTQIGSWTVEEHNQLHVEEVSWLREQTAQAARDGVDHKRRFLVVTHHAPCLSGISKPEHSGSVLSSAFATDLLSEEWPGVHTWVFGHTHFNCDFVEDGIRIVANQKGYNTEQRFDPMKVIKL
ncbi:Hypothetical protein D9617_8g048630 [Elsinoe fawcettii]|nr:Hypothetical protein D9617_8g048630 [Elsinoe fawcettii]